MPRSLSLCFSLLLLLLALGAHAGSGQDHVKGAGNVVRKALVVAAFHGIESQGAIDVVLTPAVTQQVEVEGQENLIGLVTTEVKNGIWIISTSKGYSTDKPFMVHISAPVIDVVRVEGSSDVKGSASFTAGSVDLAIRGSGDIDMAFTADRVRAAVEGSGDLKLSGACTQFAATSSGSGDIEARALIAARVSATSRGSGDLFVTAHQRLDAVVMGSGDVVYGGAPATVDKRITGSGEVRELTTGGRL